MGNSYRPGCSIPGRIWISGNPFFRFACGPFCARGLPLSPSWHHQCDCQMVVLLVYQQENPPVTLVAHGHDSHTSIILVETPQQSLDLQVEETIRYALAPQKFSGADHDRWAHAAWRAKSGGPPADRRRSSPGSCRHA